MCKSTCHVEKLYAITRFKIAGDLRRKVLIDHLRKKLKRKIRRKERKMAKNFEDMRSVPDESIDTEDSLELNEFFQNLKAVKPRN